MCVSPHFSNPDISGHHLCLSGTHGNPLSTSISTITSLISHVHNAANAPGLKASDHLPSCDSSIAEIAREPVSTRVNPNQVATQTPSHLDVITERACYKFGDPGGYYPTQQTSGKRISDVSMQKGGTSKRSLSSKMVARKSKSETVSSAMSVVPGRTNTKVHGRRRRDFAILVTSDRVTVVPEKEIEAPKKSEQMHRRQMV